MDTKSIWRLPLIRGIRNCLKTLCYANLFAMFFQAVFSTTPVLMSSISPQPGISQIIFLTVLDTDTLEWLPGLPTVVGNKVTVGIKIDVDKKDISDIDVDMSTTITKRI